MKRFGCRASLGHCRNRDGRSAWTPAPSRHDPELQDATQWRLAAQGTSPIEGNLLGCLLAFFVWVSAVFTILRSRVKLLDRVQKSAKFNPLYICASLGGSASFSNRNPDRQLANRYPKNHINIRISHPGSILFQYEGRYQKPWGTLRGLAKSTGHPTMLRLASCRRLNVR